MVDRGGQEVGRAGGRAQDDEILGDIGRHQEFLAAGDEPARHLVCIRSDAHGAVAALGGHGIHKAVADPHCLGADVDQIAREGRLGDLDAVGGEQVEELGLGANRLTAEDLNDALLAGPA